MQEFPETVESLILKVRNPADRAAWNQFEQLYRPVIFRIARAKGMQHADALDLVQQVLMSVACAIESYEQRPKAAKFRFWLSRITRNAILNALTRQPRDRSSGGTALLEVLSEVPNADPKTDAMINLEYRRELFRRAAEQVRGEVAESTWLSFEQTALQQRTVEAIAKQLAMSPGSVYAARSRVMRRLQDAVSQLEQADCDEE